MDDPSLVGDDEHVEQLVHERQDFVLWKTASEPKTTLFKRLAVEKFCDEKERTVVGDVVVQNPNGPIVPDGVRDVPFTKESGSNFGVDRQLRVKDFDRRSTAVAVRPGVDGSHSPDTE